MSNSAARQQLLPALIEHPERSPGELAKEMDLIQEGDEDAIMKDVDAALDKYPDKVKDFHQGKKGLLGMFMGEVMKSSKGKADPVKARQLILEELEKRKQ